MFLTAVIAFVLPDGRIPGDMHTAYGAGHNIGGLAWWLAGPVFFLCFRQEMADHPVDDDKGDNYQYYSQESHFSQPD
jgi:hypothetical protein